MPNILTSKHLQYAVYLFAALVISPFSAYAIDSEFDLNIHMLDKKLERTQSPSTHKRTGKPLERPAKNSVYTLKPGDHLYKVLARDYGITGVRADALVEKIKQMNRLSDIRHLKVGLSIVIPPIEQGGEYKAISTKKVSSDPPIKIGNAATLKHFTSQQLRMVSLPRNVGTESLETVRQVWSRLVPSLGLSGNEPFDCNDRDFSLSLDPERYPTLPAPDGGSILLDPQRTLPPLVKALIKDKAPMLRIVSEPPANRRRFFNALLDEARFYSVEKDFSVEFGYDPKITVNADFKIEKTPESLLKNDIVLLNVAENRKSMPGALLSFLESKGFRMIEASSSSLENRPLTSHLLYQITASDPQKIADSLLEALSVPFDTGRNINLYAREELGIRLEVRVDRYFEDNGQHFVIARFNGDPVNYTLIRLLETRGYRVIMLNAGDNFRAIVEKVFSRLKIPGRHGSHDLWPIREVGYGVQMSGVTIRDRRKGGGDIFLTNGEMDPLIKNLAGLNGYTVIDN
ncbi:MAG: LysM domain-containing protein [Geobacteraceae bacterium]